MIEVLKQALDAFEIAAEGGGVNFYAYAQELRKAIADLESQERNFCSRCGKRTADLTHIHTCTPPQHKMVWLTHEQIKQAVASIEMYHGWYPIEVANVIQNKLKELNP
jgi:hypothetical protein